MVDENKRFPLVNRLANHAPDVDVDPIFSIRRGTKKTKSEGTAVYHGGSFGIGAIGPVGETASVFTGDKRIKWHLLSNLIMQNVDKPNSTLKGANVRSQVPQITLFHRTSSP